jgi:hypothetical protein
MLFQTANEELVCSVYETQQKKSSGTIDKDGIERYCPDYSGAPMV